VSAVAPAARAEWSNWSSTVRGAPDRVVAVSNEEQIVDIVTDRHARSRGIGVAGTGHSFAPLISTAAGTLIDVRGCAGVIDVDHDRMTATVRAGTTLRELNRQLAAVGLALPNQSAIDEQTIGGVVATATHGSSAGRGTLSSHVCGARLVTADGAVRTVTADDPAIDAVRVHLGCLGVLTALTIEVVPAGRLCRVVRRVPLRQALEEVDALRTASYSGFWWYPHTAQAVMWLAEPTDEPVRAQRLRHDRLVTTLDNAAWHPSVARPAHYLAAVATGQAGRQVLASDHSLVGPVPPRRLQALEYAVPVERTSEAITELDRSMRRHAARVCAPVDVRFTGPDSAWLSPSNDRDVTYVGVTCPVVPGGPPEAWRAPLMVADAVLAGHGGRAHWAKVHGRTPEQVAASYPRWGEFQRLREVWDPEQVFLGPYLRNLFGVP